MNQKDSGNNQHPLKTFREFFESTPPTSFVQLSDVSENHYGNITLPAIYSYCKSKHCKRLQIFSPDDTSTRGSNFTTYTCNNCKATQRTISYVISKENEHLFAYKYGELPPFGPHISSRTSKLIGKDRDLFFKGHKCENQGLGIAAFAYYRRVVENQKNALIDAIISVANKIGAPPDSIRWLNEVKAKSQFSKATEDMKDVIPQALLIDGCHNPLFLLHRALSEGLHAQSDDECLEAAHSIRVVLDDLGIRIGNALKKEAELTSAIGQLLRKKQPDK